MRLTTVLLIASLLQVSASTFGQRITMNQQNVPLKTLFKEIRKQSGFNFYYDGRIVSPEIRSSIQVSNVSVDEALKVVLAKLPLSYEIKDRLVIITKKATPSFLENVIARFQAIDVRGRVLNEQNQPLAGATVTVKGKNQVTKTDAKGNFYLQNVDDKATLLISFVGFKTLELGVKEDLGGLILKLEDNSLDQVQVIAYGQVQKRFSTSNVGTISGEVIARQPVTNPLLALQGRTPSLRILQSSGLPGGSVDVSVQGKNSLANGTVPFYVIDGVPFTPDALGSPVMDAGLGSSAISNLNFLNPADIESITVLKDADATAIYGSRAANGAILITTKRGKAGTTKVDLNLQSGWGSVPKKIELLNTPQYLEIRREAKRNANAAIRPSDYDINGVWDTTRNIDWQDELLNKSSQYQNLQASVSGGSERTQFLAGAGYQRETTVFTGDFANVKTSVHFNVNHASNDNRFKFFLSGSYLKGKNKLPQTDLTQIATTLSPNAPKLFNDDGSINWEPHPTNPTIYTFSNPAAALLQIYTDNTDNLISNSQIAYEIIPGLNLRTSFGYNKLESNELGTRPLESINPGFPSRLRSAKYSNRSIDSWIIEPQLTFNKSYYFGVIDALVGTTFQQTKNYLLAFEGTDYNSDAQLSDLSAAGNKTVTASLQSSYRYSALFGRLNYRFKDRYILNLTARRDGSSRFGSENLFNNFYSLSGAWLFSEESFFQSLSKVMNFGKLRLSYGTTGNDQIGEYMFYSLYDNLPLDIPYQGTVGITPRGLPNPYLQWEETRKLNVGLDLGFFNNRINVSTNYFRNRSSNQLLNQNLSIVAGSGTILRNLPATVQNTGWELVFDYTPVKTNNFNWTGSLNLTVPQNKLIKYDNLESSTDANVFFIGKSLNTRRVYDFAGVNPETGLYQIIDAKGNLTSNPSDPADKILYINTDPKWYGGFSNTFSYKGFSLDVFFSFVKQLTRTNRFGNFPGINPNVNQPISVLKRWQKQGDIAEIQKVTTSFAQIRVPTGGALDGDESFVDGAYARLKNASISYTFNSALIRKLKLSNARVYFSGQNLLTITSLSGGLDAETVAASVLPPLRVFSFGTQLTF